jgi:hypothetical protein
MTSGLRRRPTATDLLGRLIEAPDLPRRIRALPARGFSALVQHVGVEDAAEIVALATTEQVVTAFDEELFAGPGPGEREIFDVHRFIVWLEVILEAGDEVAARRMAELSEDFVVQALSSIVLVMDHDALRARMAVGGTSAFHADKALESALSEEIDGYLLLSRIDEGWDAALALILALDRDHRSLLERLLDRCSTIGNEYVDDLDALTEVLTAAESLSEDVEAEREERRGRLGYVEPRAARAFLELAREPLEGDASAGQRDPLTCAYFRDLERLPAAPAAGRTVDLHEALGRVKAPRPALPAPDDAAMPFIQGMQGLKQESAVLFGERMEELAYLANVLVAGEDLDGRRMRPGEAAEAALATVALGSEIEARRRRPGNRRAGADEHRAVLRTCPADLLFRRARGTLEAGLVRSRAELDAAIDGLAQTRK